MLKKVMVVCYVLTLLTVLAGVAGGIQINSTSNPSPASAPTNLQYQSYTGTLVGTATAAVSVTPTPSPVVIVTPTPVVSATPPVNIQSYTGPYVGSKNSDVYHYPWCPEAKKIKPENLVVFATVADACAAGYRLRGMQAASVSSADSDSTSHTGLCIRADIGRSRATSNLRGYALQHKRAQERLRRGELLY